MNYRRIYESIIEKAKSENRKKGNGIYYESHHIVPRCLGGSNAMHQYHFDKCKWG